MKSIRRYILTGAPGTGKTSVLNLLQKRGFNCYREVSREIIRQQQKTGGHLFPWEDLSGFAKECCNQMEHQIFKAEASINFYDRAIPDNIAYLQSKNLPLNKKYYQQLHLYEKKVFYFPVWSKIFKNDPQRPETLERAIELDFFLRKVYLGLGFELIEIKKTNIDARASFIASMVNF